MREALDPAHALQAQRHNALIEGNRDAYAAALAAEATPTTAIAAAAAAVTRAYPLPSGLSRGEASARYHGYTRDQLRGLLRARGLSPTGLKGDLVGRLLDDDHAYGLLSRVLNIDQAVPLATIGVRMNVDDVLLVGSTALGRGSSSSGGPVF